MPEEPTGEAPSAESQSALVPIKPVHGDRRAHSRYGVYASAVVYLVKIGSSIQGRVLDLSLSGCRIRTKGRMTVGIYRQVEVEFRLDGLPFRLGGVLQAFHDRQTVGIRFIDMSNRKRDQLEQLIRDIEEKRARVNPDAAAEGFSSRLPGSESRTTSL
jgi:c-di-GMP-binding flagellar brake protein YcgR